MIITIHWRTVGSLRLISDVSRIDKSENIAFKNKWHLLKMQPRQATLKPYTTLVQHLTPAVLGRSSTALALLTQTAYPYYTSYIIPSAQPNLLKLKQNIFYKKGAICQVYLIFYISTALTKNLIGSEDKATSKSLIRVWKPSINVVARNIWGYFIHWTKPEMRSTQG